ncbi:MAG TPA: transglutaminaseTgpA domain-containing protein, partial [Pyrinomonadaceae bacterium]
MSFERFFRASSYGMVACGVLALAVAGGVGLWELLVFAALLALSWRLAGTRWQLSERKALAVILLSLPLFYLDWTLNRGAALAPGETHPSVAALAHFTLLLSLIKLFQTKTDRDWIFLYLISFFQVLLAAGMTASLSFFLSLALYMFAAVVTVVCFELRKAARVAPAGE